MKQLLFYSLSFLLIPLGYSQNGLLLNPSTDPITLSTNIDDIEIVTQGDNSVLFCSSSDDRVFYALDINGNSSSEASGNVVSEITDFSTLIDDAIGQSNTKILTFEVHPTSKRIYALVEHTSGNTAYIVEIKNNGTDVSTLDLTSISHSKINWPSGTDYNHEDMTWGADKLIATSGNWTLESQISILEPPFEHGTTSSYRLTSMYKTNWGGGYFTRAPLEKVEYANINGVDRLLGVTVCAPGFSIPYTDIPGTGTLEVEEQFNVNFDPPIKVVHQEQDNGHFLYDLHDVWQGKKLIRVGETFLDGSPLAANEINADVKYIKTNSGEVTAGLTEEEGKIYTNVFEQIAFWDNCNLLVLEDNTLKLFETGQSSSCTNLSTEEFENTNAFTISPNPASSFLTLTINKQDQEFLRYAIVTMDGRIIQNNSISTLETDINISSLPKGTYLFELYSNTQTKSVQKLVIQ